MRSSQSLHRRHFFEFRIFSWDLLSTPKYCRGVNSKGRKLADTEDKNALDVRKTRRTHRSFEKWACIPLALHFMGASSAFPPFVLYDGRCPCSASAISNILVFDSIECKRAGGLWQLASSDGRRTEWPLISTCPYRGPGLWFYFQSFGLWFALEDDHTPRCLGTPPFLTRVVDHNQDHDFQRA